MVHWSFLLHSVEQQLEKYWRGSLSTIVGSPGELHLGSRFPESNRVTDRLFCVVFLQESTVESLDEFMLDFSLVIYVA